MRRLRPSVSLPHNDLAVCGIPTFRHADPAMSANASGCCACAARPIRNLEDAEGSREEDPQLLQTGASNAEARTGFEPAYNGFANRCLTTWLPRRTHNAGAEKVLIARRRSRSKRHGHRAGRPPAGAGAQAAVQRTCHSLPVVSRSSEM